MQTRSRRIADIWFFVLLILFSLMLLFTPGCAKPQPPLTQTGQIAVADTQVIKAIDIVRDTAIAMNAQTPPLLPTATVRKIVNFHESAVKVIEATPNGWKPIVLAALGQLQTDLPAADWQRIQPYVTLVVTLINGVA